MPSDGAPRAQKPRSPGTNSKPSPIAIHSHPAFHEDDSPDQLLPTVPLSLSPYGFAGLPTSDASVHLLGRLTLKLKEHDATRVLIRPELLQEQLEYGAADAVVALELSKIFEQWFAENEPHYRQAYEFLRSLIYPLARQLSHGVPFDIDYHNGLIARWEQELK